jgi:hypothetical protein
MEKYPNVFDNSLYLGNEDLTLIFEWESPVNRIVIKHDEVDVKLIGAIKHEDYTLFTQSELDGCAQYLRVPRPRVFDFDSVDDLVDSVHEFQGIEGVCLYSENGQRIHKVKAPEYLAKHRLKDSMRTIEHVMDYYFKKECPKFNDFYQMVESEIDWETAEECRADMSRICDGMSEVKAIVEHMREVVEPLKTEQRRTAANIIKQKYGNTNRCAYAFKLLDGKELNNDMLKKLMFQVLK